VKKIFAYISDLLSITIADAKGFLMLLIICIAALTVIFFPKLIIHQQQEVSISDVEKLDSLINLIETRKPSQDSSFRFLFDPNLIAFDSLLLLGFPNHVAQRVVNYREKGGEFFTKNDLTKIYGLDEELYHDIEHLIDLPDSSIVAIDHIKFDINKVSRARLASMPAVSEAIARRLINYRAALGGFITMQQLQEVYEMDEACCEAIGRLGFVRDGFRPKLIRINEATAGELASHPYVSNRLADDIIRFREINGAIRSKDLLAGFKSVDESNFDKLISYLDFN
jgi:competence protein ComEA